MKIKNYLIFVVFILLTSVVNARVFKCDNNGNIKYQQSPCKGNGDEVKIVDNVLSTKELRDVMERENIEKERVEKDIANSLNRMDKNTNKNPRVGLRNISTIKSILLTKARANKYNQREGDWSNSEVMVLERIASTKTDRSKDGGMSMRQLIDRRSIINQAQRELGWRTSITDLTEAVQQSR